MTCSKPAIFQFAAFLTLNKKLRFISIETSPSGSADICFDDPNDIGADLELAFINNEPATFVTPNDYHQALKNLRGSIQRTLNRSRAVPRG